ncbi:MAG: hypothetical protein WBF53_14385 [Litorimonas sp.]
MSVFSVHDWVLLTLLVFLGLVLARVAIITAVVTSHCAEDIASAGVGPSGVGTVWDALHASAWLAAA